MSQEFFVKCNDQRTDWEWPHKVPSDDVEALWVWTRGLLPQPALQTVPVLLGQSPQGLSWVQGDVSPACGQVQTGNKQPFWNNGEPESNKDDVTDPQIHTFLIFGFELLFLVRYAV